MKLRLAVLLLAAVVPLAGCPEDRVCNPDPSDNTCGSDSDCVLAYCAPECCWCPRAYSRAQVDSTWCLTPYGGTTPIAECLQGRTDRCVGGAPCVCTYSVEPWCNAGKCDLRALTP
jgi:hypothetical protein